MQNEKPVKASTGFYRYKGWEMQLNGKEWLIRKPGRAWISFRTKKAAVAMIDEREGGKDG